MIDRPALRLRNAPIIEAVLDVDCDLPPGFDLAAIEGASRERFRDQYPKFRTLFVQEHKIEANAEAPLKMSVRRGVQAFQFKQDDEKQLVQVRSQGYSFNRLAPYSTLDEYLPEIERTWRLYLDVVSPVQVRVIRLRYINRILLPMEGGKVDLDDYLKTGPRLADEDGLGLITFLNQYTAVETVTGHQINVVLTSQPPEGGTLPIIFDLSVANPLALETTDWPRMLAIILSLRVLKNRIFVNTLAERCIKLFQQ